jgi:hypothetical protein
MTRLDEWAIREVRPRDVIAVVALALVVWAAIYIWPTNWRYVANPIDGALVRVHRYTDRVEYYDVSTGRWIDANRAYVSAR